MARTPLPRRARFALVGAAVLLLLAPAAHVGRTALTTPDATVAAAEGADPAGDAVAGDAADGTGAALARQRAEAADRRAAQQVAAQARVDAAVLAAATGDSTASLGVAVRDVDAGVSGSGALATQPFYSASMVKLVVAIDVLDQRAAGAAVDATDLELVAAALGPSDDGAMNQLWSEFDGVGGVGRVAARLGLTATSAPDDPSQWGNTLLSAADVASVYDYVLTDAPAADRDFLVAALSAATPEAADGFDQGFGLLGTGATATKQGWSCCLDGEVQLHSSGVVTDAAGDRTVVVVMSSLPTGYGPARTVVDATAAAAVASLTAAPVPAAAAGGPTS